MAGRLPSRRYTAQDDARIRAMRAEGRTWMDIGRAFGVHGTSIRQRLIRVLQEDDPHPEAERQRAAARCSQEQQAASQPIRRPLALRTRDGGISIAALEMLRHQQAAATVPVPATEHEIAAWARANHLPPACQNTLTHVNTCRASAGLPPFTLRKEQTP